MAIKDKSKTQKIITMVSANYMELLVRDLFLKALEFSRRRDYAKKTFQMSIMENTHATAAVVQSVLAIESYRNRVYYLKKRKVGNPVKDLVNILEEQLPGIANTSLRKLLTEVFILRDVIVHNHIYEVHVYHDANWDMIGHRQRLLEGYGDDKLKNNITKTTRKTKLLKLNVQPIKIGFEEVVTVFVVFDLLIGLLQKALPNNYAPFRFNYKINGKHDDNMSKFIAYYFDQIPNLKLKTKLQLLINDLKKEFTPFLGTKEVIAGQTAYNFAGKYVINNTCPKCKAFGFNKPNGLYKCSKCGCKI